MPAAIADLQRHKQVMFVFQIFNDCIGQALKHITSKKRENEDIIIAK